MHRAEYECSRGACGYECAVGNAVRSAFSRTKPDECPQCGASLDAVG